jgi:DNA primase
MLEREKQMTILDLTEQDGIHLKRVASTHGGEYAGPCPVCGGKDRFRVWPEEGQGGKYWCREEDKGGDCIQYLRDMRDMSYQDACSFLGRDPGPMDTEKKPVSRPEWEPREVIKPADEWILKCSAFVDYCESQLWGDIGKDILEWLKSERGLSEDTIKSFHLGWNPKDLWRERKSWGLPDELKPDGKVKKMWLPGGVVIPCYADKALQRARIRRFNPEHGPRYCIVSGSATGPMILGSNHKVYVIVESELDAILLHQEIGDMASVISLGNAQTRPDKVTAELLRGADLILVALDGDDPGAKEAWVWWPQHFQQAKRLPPVDGKDPGEMWKAGVSLKDWIGIGVEEFQQGTPLAQESEPAPKQSPCQVAIPEPGPEGAELISRNLQYLSGIDEDLTGWKLWKRIEQGKEHRVATDPAGVIRWEQWYSLEPRLTLAAGTDQGHGNLN